MKIDYSKALYNRGYRKGHSRGYREGINIVLSKIRAEIESYKLSEDELIEMDEDSIKWGMKIAYDIVSKYHAETYKDVGEEWDLRLQHR